MKEKIEALKKEKKRLEQEMSRPLLNPEKIKQLSLRYGEIEEVLKINEELERIEKEIKDTEELLSQEKDPEMIRFLKNEAERLQRLREDRKKKLKEALIPKDPRWSKNCIVEIRAAAGGDEASLFAADLFRMYVKYIEKRNWKYEVLSMSPSEIGGFKEIIFFIKNKEVFKYMRFESGVHRVQRIPVTETGGRIHTSTATVAVLPEAEEKDVNIRPEDLKMEVFRASGHGGQHVNVTDSAVRITHIPTGIVVSCQDERSQHQNRAKALRILYARLKEKYRKEEEEKLLRERKQQIKTGERSEKIRTYNFPQNRVTDHRINVSLYNLSDVMDGDLFELHSMLLEKEMEGYGF